MYKCKELLTKAMDHNISLVELVCKGREEEDKNRKLNDLRESMKIYCHVDNNFNKYEICESELEKRRGQDDIENNKNFSELLAELSKKKENVLKHEMYCKLEEKIKMTLGEIEEGLEITEAAPNIICPVSKQVMTSPMTNKLCGHVYDQSSVNQLLHLNKKGIRCPVPGCVKAPRFKASDLEANEAIMKYILLKKKQQN